MSKLIDLTNQRFGNLVVLHRIIESRDSSCHHAKWLCQCDCGKFIVAISTNLTKGNTKSCGCQNTKVAKINYYKNNFKRRSDII